MSIFTTEHHGLAAGLSSPHFHMAQASMNGIRLERYNDFLHRSGNTPTSSDAADCARPTGRAVFWPILGALALAAWAYACTVMVMSIGGPEPVTRTFERPVSNDTYTRTQMRWEIEE